VFSDDRVIMGKYNANTLYVSGNRVGIGKIPTNATLDVSGSAIVSGSKSVTSTANPTQFKVSTTTAGGYSQIYLSNPTRDFILTNNAGDSLLSFNYGGANRLQFDTTNQWFNSGNLGIGTTSPTSYKLHVIGDIYANGGWFRVSGTNGIYWESYGGGWYMNDSSWLRAYNDKAIITNNEIRGTVFKDANDATYYVDPATGTNLNGTLVNNGGTAMTGGWNRNLLLSSTFPVIVFNSNSTKYSGIGVDYSAAAAGMYFWVNGSSADISGTATVALGLNTGNYVTAYGSFRAPVFYDSNDTAYYTDPASTSILSKLSVGNAPYVASLQAGALELGRTDTNYQYTSGWTGTMQGGILANCADNWEFVIHDSGHRLASAFEFRGSGTNVMRLGRDLGWGVTPIEIPGNLTVVGNTSFSGTINQSGPGRTTTITTSNFDAKIGSSDLYFYFKSIDGGSYPGAIQFMRVSDGATSWPLSLMPNGGNVNIGDLQANTYKLQVNGITYSSTDVRAPVFYDSNNTAYYIDANNTFVLNAATFAGTITVGNGATNSYIYMGDSDEGTRAIHCNSNRIGFLNQSSGWGSYCDDSGYWQSEYSIRGPLFYDSNDTRYYVDPNNTGVASSNLRGRVHIVGNHNYSSLRVYLPAAENGNNTGDVTLQMWCSEPGISWDGAGFGYNVTNDNGTPSGFGRINTSFGQAYMRFVTSGDWILYNTNTSGTRSISLQTDSSGIFYAYNQIRTPIIYDYNDTNYYVDPASTSRVNTISFVSGATFGPYLQYSNTNNLRLQGGSNSTEVGLVGYDYNGNWRFQLYGGGSGYGFLNGNWAGWDIQKVTSGNLYLNNQTTYYIGTSEIYYNRVYGLADIRSPIFYDNNNTGYYVDPASNTVLSEVYANSWFRNQNSNTGLYNQTTTQHLSSNTNGYWDMSSTTTISGIRFYTGGHMSALRGYVYSTDGNDIGFLNNGGNWRLRVVGGDYILADGSSIRGQLFYDSNNTAYYFDGASTSIMNNVQITTLGVGTAASGTSGEIRATNNITAYYSDERLKTRLGKIENALEKVKSLDGFYFSPNDTAMALGYKKTIDVGVSAQQVKEILPEIIAPAPIDPQYMTVRYEKMIPLLIEAIKEQQKQIETLTERLSALEKTK